MLLLLIVLEYLPFDITAPESLSDDYAGTHTIRWYDLDFPVDGNYNIEVAVDDNVNLRFVNKNGEETSIEKKDSLLLLKMVEGRLVSQLTQSFLEQVSIL